MRPLGTVDSIICPFTLDKRFSSEINIVPKKKIPEQALQYSKAAVVQRERHSNDLRNSLK